MKIQFVKLIVMILFLNICYVLQGQVNLLKNGDFEIVKSGKISNWLLLTKDATFISSAKGQFSDGKLSALLKSKSNDPAIKALVNISSGHIIDIEPGKEYSLSFYAKSASKLEQPLIAFFYTSPIKNFKHWYKIKKINLGTDWTKYTFKVRLPDSKKWLTRKLEIRFSIFYGSAYIDKVNLVCEDKKKVASSRKRRNILENPGFDNGISSWLTCQYYAKTTLDKRMIKIDRSVKHDGIASLKIPAYGMGLCSRRYEFKPNQKYTLSFFAKTDGNKGRGINVIIRDMQYKKVSVLKLRSNKLSKNWKRYSLSFKSPSLGEPYANSLLIRVDPLSTVWMDSFQLEEGNMTNYSPGPQVGISFNNAGVFDCDKDEIINISVSIPNAKMTKEALKVIVKCNDILGNTIFSIVKKISMDKSTKLIPLTVKFKRLGVIRVTASLLTGKTRLAFAEWNGFVTNKSKNIAPNSFFGTDVRAGSVPYRYAQANEKLEKLMGTGINRTFFTNYIVREHPNLRQDNPALLKMVKANYALEKAAGRKVIIAVSPDVFSPLNLRNMHKAKRNSLPPGVLDKEIKIFAKQSFNIASALSKEVDIFEILNEPNIWRFNGKRIIPPEIYIRILKNVSKAIRSAAPEMQIAANINCLDFNYAKKIFELGAAKYIDIFTIHPYRANAEKPSVYDDIKKLRIIIDKYNPKIKIINDEQYYGSRNIMSNSEYDRHYCAMSEDDCAARIVQTALHGIAADKVPFVLHGNHFYVGISNAPYYCFPFGTLRTLSSIIRDVRFAEQIEISKKLRIFLFGLKSGEKIVSINTREYETQIKFEMSPIFDSIIDAEGNILPKKNVLITYLPIYYIFGAETSLKAIKESFKKANFSGAGFPFVVSLKRLASGDLLMTLTNTSSKDAIGSIKIKKAPKVWRVPAAIKFNLKAFASKRITLKASGDKADWRKGYTLDFAGEYTGGMTTGSVKVPAFFIDQAHNRLVVDGDLSDWQNSAWVTLDKRSLSRNFNPRLPYKGDEDISAKISFRWTSDGFYLAAKVTDNKFVSGSIISSLYKYDCIQIYFTPKNDVKKGGGYGLGDISYSLGIDKRNNTVAWLTRSPGTRFIGASNAITGKDADVKTAFKKRKGGYTYEAFFPDSTIPGIKLKPGSVFGLSILINDNDGKGRKQGLTLGPKYTEPYQKPYLWPCVQLK